MFHISYARQEGHHAWQGQQIGQLGLMLMTGESLENKGGEGHDGEVFQMLHCQAEIGKLSSPPITLPDVGSNVR